VGLRWYNNRLFRARHHAIAAAFADKRVSHRNFIRLFLFQEFVLTNKRRLTNAFIALLGMALVEIHQGYLLGHSLSHHPGLRFSRNSNQLFQFALVPLTVLPILQAAATSKAAPNEAASAF
jgi:hypothetical protein